MQHVTDRAGTLQKGIAAEERGRMSLLHDLPVLVTAAYMSEQKHGYSGTAGLHDTGMITMVAETCSISSVLGAHVQSSDLKDSDMLPWL